MRWIRKKNGAAQLAELASRLSGLEPKIKKLDQDASSVWVDCLAENAGIASKIIQALGKQKIDVSNVRLEIIDALITTTESISRNLVSGASSLHSMHKMDLNEYVLVLEKDFERLKDVLKLLAVFLLWIAAQGYLTSAGGPPCDDECTPSNNVVTTRVINVNATLLPGAIRTYQPQCHVEWDFCCTNRCFIFYRKTLLKRLPPVLTIWVERCGLWLDRMPGLLNWWLTGVLLLLGRL